jgi:hypothetical protein
MLAFGTLPDRQATRRRDGDDHLTIAELQPVIADPVERRPDEPVPSGGESDRRDAAILVGELTAGRAARPGGQREAAADLHCRERWKGAGWA